MSSNNFIWQAVHWNVVYIFINIYILNIYTFLKFNIKTPVLIFDVYKDYKNKRTACFLITKGIRAQVLMWTQWMFLINFYKTPYSFSFISSLIFWFSHLKETLDIYFIEANNMYPFWVPSWKDSPNTQGRFNWTFSTNNFCDKIQWKRSR